MLEALKYLCFWQNCCMSALLMLHANFICESDDGILTCVINVKQKYKVIHNFRINSNICVFTFPYTTACSPCNIVFPGADISIFIVVSKNWTI